ncbi:MAG: aldose 1-epimerase family protein [Oscillospiraceae bacterium]|nr:aldose 1-epimerase family protein [Oscillospiraceae bacterium]
MPRENKEYSQKLKYVGNKNQLFSVKNYIMTDGRANNLRAIDIINGKGLFMTILPDRCMDIYQLIYKDTNICYITAAGAVHPSYYDNRGTEFLRSFFAGFLTTCGLETICGVSDDDGEELGLHGRISNTPADNFYARIIEDNTESGEPEIIITGTMSQARLFGDKYSLTREIKIYTNENKFEIRDIVKNTGYKKSPHMILYHLNYGYPFLDENIEINIPIIESETVPVDDYAAKDLDKWDKFNTPQHGIDEQCYYHKLKTDENGYAKYSLYNPNLKKGISVKYNAKTLDYFIEWKMPGEGDYVLGLEPGNAKGGGRKQNRDDGTLKFLEPLEEVKYHLVVTLSGERGI